MSKKTINIFTENIYPDWNVDEVEIISIGRKVVDFYLKNLIQDSCLNGYEFDTLTFDILFCDSVKTHQINKEYRDKDYPADIITFAIFADDDAKFILLKSVDESVRADISIFLQSFWADIERKEIKDGILKYIQLFEEKLYG